MKKLYVNLLIISFVITMVIPLFAGLISEDLVGIFYISSYGLSILFAVLIIVELIKERKKEKKEESKNDISNYWTNWRKND